MIYVVADYAVMELDDKNEGSHPLPCLTSIVFDVIFEPQECFNLLTAIPLTVRAGCIIVTDSILLCIHMYALRYVHRVIIFYEDFTVLP